eukprot:5058698-Pleurochrysis_carterae.AAC.2
MLRGQCLRVSVSVHALLRFVKIPTSKPWAPHALSHAECLDRLCVQQHAGRRYLCDMSREVDGIFCFLGANSDRSCRCLRRLCRTCAIFGFQISQRYNLEAHLAFSVDLSGAWMDLCRLARQNQSILIEIIFIDLNLVLRLCGRGVKSTLACSLVLLALALACRATRLLHAKLTLPASHLCCGDDSRTGRKILAPTRRSEARPRGSMHAFRDSAFPGLH